MATNTHWTPCFKPGCPNHIPARLKCRGQRVPEHAGLFYQIPPLVADPPSLQLPNHIAVAQPSSQAPIHTAAATSSSQPAAHEHAACQQATLQAQAVVKKVRSTVTIFAWTSLKQPDPHEFQDHVINGHFVLSEEVLERLKIAGNELQVYCPSFHGWSMIPKDHVIPLTSGYTVTQDALPVVLLQQMGVDGCNGLDDLLSTPGSDLSVCKLGTSMDLTIRVSTHAHP
ncbi:hypothetical protein BT96DRAFT_994873 [Gymnopus androsaceus JB14]|uniref:Uncharacterized protein n=1 Tax=Gymnopus androsaceus JB14 TaxID=1447944 RepID=A0A6A4HN08_9AGAR|nr:hypothetical protein BT96DRAFT_994873 [Gymnopus androsaceus JB14]